MQLSTLHQQQGTDHLSKDLEVLRAEMAKLQLVNRQQSQLTTNLHEVLSKKQEEVEALESSNTALRKQLVAATTNEESARKQLV